MGEAKAARGRGSSLALLSQLCCTWQLAYRSPGTLRTSVSSCRWILAGKWSEFHWHYCKIESRFPFWNFDSFFPLFPPADIQPVLCPRALLMTGQGERTRVMFGGAQGLGPHASSIGLTPSACLLGSPGLPSPPPADTSPTPAKLFCTTRSMCTCVFENPQFRPQEVVSAQAPGTTPRHSTVFLTAQLTKQSDFMLESMS